MGRVGCAGEERTANNVLRHEYRLLTELEKAQMKRVKDMGAEMLAFLDTLGSSREISLAKTKIEEAVMWGVKHVTR